MTSSTHGIPVVIDTQIVMDWLVFRDPSCEVLAAAAAHGRLCWHSSPRMRDELRHVLGRGVAADWHPDLALIEAAFKQHATQMEQEPPSALHLLRCRDTDDQMFLDLALAVKARWLFSRDRAVLALAKRARLHGLEIIKPAAWSE